MSARELIVDEARGKEIRGAEAIFYSLLAEGVDTIFGYPGGAIMPAYDALYGFSDSIRHILVRHEQGASHAAEGYARVTGKAGVVLVTSGPGATNLITGIADAQMDSIPMVCITGQVFKDYLGSDAFQETDVIGISMPITKWNYQVTEASQIPSIISKAFFIAQEGRPGPVVIDITKNAQNDLMIFDYKKTTSIENFDSKPVLNKDSIKEAAKLINSAKKPLIFAGHGILISKCEEELKQLSELADIPVACTLHGLSAFPTGHKNHVGMLGMHGNYGPNVLCNEADVIIAAGMRFDDRVTGDLRNYLTKSKIIHIDIDSAELEKNVKNSVSIHADLKDALVELLPQINKSSNTEWLDKFSQCAAKENEKVIENAIHPKTPQLKMGEVINLLSEKTNGEAVIVADVGQHQMMAARYYKYKLPDSWITSGGLGTMGFALPAAIGAKIGRNDRNVIVIVGDGGFQMTIQELGTIAQENLNVKVIVLNNNFLGMVRQWQEMFFEKRYSFVDLHNPDFVKVSEGFGVKASKVATREDISKALDQMLNYQGAYVLEVEVEKETNVFPMVPAGASVADIRLE